MEEEKKPEFRERAEISFGTLVGIDKKKRTVTIDHKNGNTGQWFTEEHDLDDEWTDDDMNVLLNDLGQDLNFTIIDGKVIGVDRVS